jgi:hypothetical protein
MGPHYLGPMMLCARPILIPTDHKSRKYCKVSRRDRYSLIANPLRLHLDDCLPSTNIFIHGFRRSIPTHPVLLLRGLAGEPVSCCLSIMSPCLPHHDPHATYICFAAIRLASKILNRECSRPVSRERVSRSRCIGKGR